MSNIPSESTIGCVAAIFIVLVLSLIFVIKVAGGLGEHYSDGERSGVVVKISRRGLMLKSWEGDLNLGSASSNSDGVMVPSVFEFSVTNAEVATKIQEAARSGVRVSLRYKQWFIRPISISTDYDIVEVIPLTRVNPEK